MADIKNNEKYVKRQAKPSNDVFLINAEKSHPKGKAIPIFMLPSNGWDVSTSLDMTSLEGLKGYINEYISLLQVGLWRNSCYFRPY